MLTYENTVVYPPNKNLDRKLTFSTSPVIYNHLLFLDFNQKDQAILGSSNVNDTLWEGTLLFFNNEDSLQQLKYSGSYIGSTTTDGKFLNDTTVVLAEDNGILNVLSIAEEKQLITSINYFKEINRITKIAVWQNSSKVLTSSGNSVTIWDVNSREKLPNHQFEDYHTELVNYVDTVKEDQNTFLSASVDRRCCIWDIRASNPALVLYSNEFCSLTTISCNQNDANYAVVGTEGGNLYLVDKRQPKDFISVTSLDCCIHRTAFGGSGKFAVCGDVETVTVFECGAQFKQVYDSNKHQAIVRGITWHNDSLYSCGFDKKIIKHVL